MSALPVEEPPSGAAPARREIAPRRLRSRPGGAARPSRRPQPRHVFFPDKDWLLPDGDWTFPGGGVQFPEGERLSPAGRPVTQRPSGAHRPVRLAAETQPLSLEPDGRQRPGLAAGAQRSLRPVAGGERLLRPVPSPAEHASATPAPRVLRLTRRGRLVVAILAAVAACGLVVAGASAAQASGPVSAHRGDEQVVVLPGDTLWSIAQSADPNADAQTVVQEILHLNRISGAAITAGQRLWVPRP